MIALLSPLVFIASCGDDDDVGTAALPLAERVDEFDRVCADTVATLADSDLTADESAQIQERALADMRAIAAPDHEVDTAASLLADIEESLKPDLSETAIEELDQRIRDAATQFGVSDECIGGTAGA